jgi:hypothetical protein
MQILVYLHGDLFACHLQISMKQKENDKNPTQNMQKQE